MKIVEIITEAVTPTWGRKTGKAGGQLARRYRCMSGFRKGRVVANVATCVKPKNIQKSLSLKRTSAKRGGIMRFKTARTKRATSSQRVKRLNIGGRNKSKSYRSSKRKALPK